VDSNEKKVITCKEKWPKNRSVKIRVLEQKNRAKNATLKELKSNFGYFTS